MSLKLTRADLQDEVGRALGYGRGTLSGDLLEDVTVCIERGLRQFYTPEPLPGERMSHRWSFLRTVEGLDTYASTTSHTGTVSGTGISSLSSNMSTTDVVSISHVTISNGTTTVTRRVTSIDGATQFTVNENIGMDGAGRTIKVFYSGAYVLPTSFAGIDGPLTYDTYFGTDPNVADQTIEVTSEAKLRDMFQYLEDRDDKPRVAAISQINATSASDGTRHVLHLYPIPDAAYRLKYTQINEPVNITATNHVPLGSSLHSETILASCLAIAEQFFIPQSPHGYQQSYLRRLAASIELDRAANRSETLGYNADPSEFGSVTGFTDARLSRYLHDNRVTVNGVQY